MTTATIPMATHAGPSRAVSAPDANADRAFASSLLQYRDAVIEEMSGIIAAKRFQRHLAARLAEYPLRAGKGLRPALCLATCEAFGGRRSDALPSAVALELFHNAFLVHDDIEDESSHRRGEPTIHQKYGLAIAINIGDALSVLAMTPLLGNLEVIGLGRTLRIFREIERMARESVEGQAMELDWVKTGEWNLTEHDYYVMTRKKTCWYTCITPCRIGAIIAGARADRVRALMQFGRCLGIAFQIQDDVLNLAGEQDIYGKESAGDIWEGKRTLMLIALMQRASIRERHKLLRIMSAARCDKTEPDVRWVVETMHKHDCIEYGRAISRRFARNAGIQFETAMGDLPETTHKQFLQDMIAYVIRRDQ
ncbi:MAG: polyprenyl synthetase family protein [Gemmatimonadaceae bacterium]